jgi:hypothetical protein
MRGSMASQCCGLLNQSGILRIGESKFSAQKSIRNELRQTGQSADRQKVAKYTGLYNGETAHQYLSSWVSCALNVCNYL